MKKRYYIVNYKNNNRIENDLFNTIEMMFLLLVCRFDSNVVILNMKRGEFYE